MPNKTTAAEAADRIAEHYRIHFAKEGERAHFITEALKMAVSVLRRVASDEYAPVVRCKKCRNFSRKDGMWYGLDGFCEKTNKFVAKDFYCAFGALMGGKDDSHETD